MTRRAALARSRDRSADGELDSLTIARTRDILLAPGAAAWARRYRNGLGSEVIAAIAKVMTGNELAAAAEIARTVMRMVKQRRSGVALGG